MKEFIIGKTMPVNVVSGSLFKAKSFRLSRVPFAEKYFNES